MVRYRDDLPLVAGISLYANETERSRHIEQIVSIARQKKRSVTMITAWYEYILAELKPRARIPDYLGIFVTRKVIALLQTNKRPGD